MLFLLAAYFYPLIPALGRDNFTFDRFNCMHISNTSFYDKNEVTSFYERFKDIIWEPANKSIYPFTDDNYKPIIQLNNSNPDEPRQEIILRYKDSFYGYADIIIGDKSSRYKITKNDFDWLYEYVKKYTLDNNIKKQYFKYLYGDDTPMSKIYRGKEISYMNISMDYISIQKDFILAHLRPSYESVSYGSNCEFIGGFQIYSGNTYSPDKLNLYIIINDNIYALDDAYLKGFISRKQLRKVYEALLYASSNTFSWPEPYDYTTESLILNDKRNVEKVAVEYKFGNTSSIKEFTEPRAIDDAIDTAIRLEDWTIKASQEFWENEYKEDIEYFILDYYIKSLKNNFRDMFYRFTFYKSNGNYYCQALEYYGMLYTYSITEDQYNNVEAYVKNILNIN